LTHEDDSEQKEEEDNGLPKKEYGSSNEYQDSLQAVHESMVLLKN